MRDRVRIRELGKTADLVVGKGDAKHVCEEEDDLLFRVIARGRRHVAFYFRDGLDLA